MNASRSPFAPPTYARLLRERARTAWTRDRGTPRVVAHRGASARALENTLSAFERARADGADAVELDVHRCRSGEIVVYHDEDLRRLAGRPERIDALSLHEIRSVRLRGGERIPTLDEALECLAGLLVNVEVKAPLGASGLALAHATARALAGRKDAERLLVSSFNPIALGLVRSEAPHLATGLLFHARQTRPLREAWSRFAALPDALHPEHPLADARSVRAWHAEGFAVNVWTVDDETRLRGLSKACVDGVITNDPRSTRAILESID